LFSNALCRYSSGTFISLFNIIHSLNSNTHTHTCKRATSCATNLFWMGKPTYSWYLVALGEKKLAALACTLSYGIWLMFFITRTDIEPMRLRPLCHGSTALKFKPSKLGWHCD
jgi:hypothetical protein